MILLIDTWAKNRTNFTNWSKPTP